MSEQLRLFFKQLEEQRARTPKIVLLWYSLTRRTRTLRSVPSRVVNVYQRARYGFGHRDLWGFDNYIAGVISRAMSDLADVSHGYPATEEFPTMDSWREFLRELSRDLKAYTVHPVDEMEISNTDELWDNLDEISDRDVSRYERGVAAMKRFSENLGSMWD